MGEFRRLAHARSSAWHRQGRAARRRRDCGECHEVSCFVMRCHVPVVSQFDCCLDGASFRAASVRKQPPREVRRNCHPGPCVCRVRSPRSPNAPHACPPLVIPAKEDPREGVKESGFGLSGCLDLEFGWFGEWVFCSSCGFRWRVVCRDVAPWGGAFSDGPDALALQGSASFATLIRRRGLMEFRARVVRLEGLQRRRRAPRVSASPVSRVGPCVLRLPCDRLRSVAVGGTVLARRTLALRARQGCKA